MRFFWGSSWEEGSNNNLTVLDVQGLKIQAIETALSQCRKKGYSLCTFQGSKIVYHNKREWTGNRYVYATWVKAIIWAVDRWRSILLKTSLPYTKENKWSVEESSTMKSLGVKAEALDDALFDCLRDGNLFCVIETTII